MDVVALILGCSVWFPLMLWIVSLVHWMIGGEVDVVTGILGISVGVSLGYICMKPPVPWLSPIAYCVVIVTMVMYPVVRASLDHRELKGIDVEMIGRAYEMIGQKPDNPMGKFKLAIHVYNVGMTGHAIAIAESVIGQMPKHHFTEEHNLLRKWKSRPSVPESVRPIECVECHSMCAPGQTHCRQCGAPFLLDRARGKVFNTQQGQKLIAAWIALVAILAGIPAATTLPPAASILVILTLLAISGGIVFVAFRNPKGSIT